MKSLSQALHPRRLRQRVSAWINVPGGDTYDRLTATRKQALLGDLHGSLLEIGPGAGPNLRYYPPDVSWVGVEPNPNVHPHLLRSVRALGKSSQQFRVVPGDPAGRRLPAMDESVDVVVSTLVLCSVPDPEESLREIVRVLKPGGRFVFLEHVAAPRGTRLRGWQDTLAPVWASATDGCHLNRETWNAITLVGFAEVEMSISEHAAVCEARRCLRCDLEFTQPDGGQ